MTNSTFPPDSPPRAPVTVVKVGGRSLGPDGELARVVAFVAAERDAGRAVVLIHGGGNAVTEEAERRGLATRTLRGQRITSPEMMAIVLEVLGGRINAEVTAALDAAGLPPCGLRASAGGTLRVRPAGDPPGALGLVGEPVGVDPTLLRALFASGFVPVLAPIGADDAGRLYNVNADRVAGAIAGALHAPLLLLTDVAAVRDRTGAELTVLDRDGAQALVDGGAATDGMIPKLESALAALSAGAPRVWIGHAPDLTPSGPLPGRGTRLEAPSPRPHRPLSLLAPRRARGRA